MLLYQLNETNTSGKRVLFLNNISSISLSKNSIMFKTTTEGLTQITFNSNEDALCEYENIMTFLAENGYKMLSQDKNSK